MSSNEPVKNGCEVIYEMFHILNCAVEIKSHSFFTGSLELTGTGSLELTNDQLPKSVAS